MKEGGEEGGSMINAAKVALLEILDHFFYIEYMIEFCN